MVTENSAVPDKSLLAQYLPANYTDAYSKEVSGRDETTPEELMQAIFTRPSPLAGALMKLRNILVKPFGLETGSLEKQVANRILCRSDREIVIGMNDKHLWFAVSLLCAPKNGGSQRITVTTIVKYNRALGKAYFFFVRPFHRLLVRRSLEKV